MKTEPTPDAVPASGPSSDRGRGRGRGRGEGRGRGRGVPRPPVEMMASGPFALGPAAAGTSSSSRRFAPAAAPIPIPTKSGPSSLGTGLSQTAAPKIKTEERKTKVDEDEEVYSDPDEGVEIIDMEKVHKMDWMAPESIGKERLAKKPKKEDPDVGAAGGTRRVLLLTHLVLTLDVEINLANALNLSESEDEEELETIIDDFAKLNNVRVIKPMLKTFLIILSGHGYEYRRRRASTLLFPISQSVPIVYHKSERHSTERRVLNASS